MLRDEDFSRKASVDRYGRKIPKATGRKELERLYRLQDEDDEADEEEDGVDDDADVRRELGRVERKYDPAREGGFSSSSSSSDETSSGEDEEEEEEDVTEWGGDGHGLLEMQIEGQNDVPTGDVSSRLAVVNLDWDNIRAVDLMAVFSSFCPPIGRILRVAVYPSQFGKGRMEREEMEGPPKEIFASRHNASAKESLSEEDNDEEDNEEDIKKSLLQEDKGEEFDSTKLRRYQLERLRYYYAVLTISSADTAKALYDATDGTEYLTTANFFDLRFVPDDVSFDDDQPRDECTTIPDGYKPNTFVTDALQHSKVKLTWDADDNVRKEVVRKAFGPSRAEIEENDLRAYLGSDTSEDEEPPVQSNGNSEETNGGIVLSKKERERQRLRAALGLGEVSSSSKRNSKDAPVGDMQITFTSGLSGSQKKDNDPDHEETTVEKYMRKEKERKQRHKERVTATRNGGLSNGNGHPHSKGNHADTDPDKEDNQESPDLGFDDPFFTSAAGQDEPSSRTKKSKSRQENKGHQEQNDALTAQQQAELELLMLDDDPTSNPNANQANSNNPTQSQGHFNMKDILRAEKKSGRKSKNKPSSKNLQHDNNNPKQQQAGFNMNVSDPRFAALYQNHEFAIDPTNPRFKDTKAMRAVLDQARRNRVRGAEVEGVVGEGVRRKRRRGQQDGDGDGDGAGEEGDGNGEELKSLVERVKRKVRTK